MRFTHENDYDAIVQTNAERFGVPGALLKAIIGHESNFVAGAKNLTGGDGARGGSYGLAQMSLATARALGYTGDAAGLLDPSTNVELAARQLGWLLKNAGAHGYGMDSAISAYNAGESAYRPGDGPRVTVDAAPPSEAVKYPFTNQAYVDDVLSLWHYFLGTGASTTSAAYAAGAAQGASSHPSTVIVLGIAVAAGAAVLLTLGGKRA